jgi:pentatricopeptide repeat protein
MLDTPHNVQPVAPSFPMQVSVIIIQLTCAHLDVNCYLPAVHAGCKCNQPCCMVRSALNLYTGRQWEHAVVLFEQMQQRGCVPDVVSYTALINACAKGCQWYRALQVSGW